MRFTLATPQHSASLGCGCREKGVQEIKHEGGESLGTQSRSWGSGGVGLGELAVGPPEPRVWEGGGGREGPRRQPRQLKNLTGDKQLVHIPGVCPLGPQPPEGRNEAVLTCGPQTQMLLL